MRSLVERIGALVLFVLLAEAVTAAALQTDHIGAPPSRAEIARAVETVKGDPNVSGTRTMKVLRFKSSEAKKSQPAWIAWILGFFQWVGESARFVVWALVAALAGILAVYVSRIAQQRGSKTVDDHFIAPTHVRDLDIRPETLPDDIGEAARRLWDSGDQRTALALLYRGMLSKLAHVHHVPIRDSSTEGDSLTLAAARLPGDRSGYLTRLVRGWQRVGYGRQPLEQAVVYELCDGFANALRPLPVDDGAAPSAETA